MEIIFIVIGLIAGFAAGYFICAFMAYKEKSTLRTAFISVTNRLIELESKQENFIAVNLNKTQIEEIIKALQEKIADFSDKVEKTHTEGLEKKAALATKIDEKLLVFLNLLKILELL